MSEAAPMMVLGVDAAPNQCGLALAKADISQGVEHCFDTLRYLELETLVREGMIGKRGKPTARRPPLTEEIIQDKAIDDYRRIRELHEQYPGISHIVFERAVGSGGHATTQRDILQQGYVSILRFLIRQWKGENTPQIYPAQHQWCLWREVGVKRLGLQKKKVDDRFHVGKEDVQEIVSHLAGEKMNDIPRSTKGPLKKVFEHAADAAAVAACFLATEAGYVPPSRGGKK